MSAVGTGVGPPSWWACAIFTSSSFSHLLPRQAGAARREQGPPEAAPRKLRVRSYLTRRVVTDTCARAFKLGRCAIRVSALCASCAKGVEHQARTEQRHVIAVFTHGRFHACTRKTIILQHSGPDALRCVVLQHPSDSAVHCDPVRAARTTQGSSAPHSRDHAPQRPCELTAAAL